MLNSVIALWQFTCTHTNSPNNQMVNIFHVTCSIHHISNTFFSIWIFFFSFLKRFSFFFFFRFVEEEIILKPALLFYVGCIGLLVNLIGLVLLYGKKMTFSQSNRTLFLIKLLFNAQSTEHGGHHGHSHAITRSNNKLAQLANTDDNENNSFVYSDGVSVDDFSRLSRWHIKLIGFLFLFLLSLSLFLPFVFIYFRRRQSKWKSQMATTTHTMRRTWICAVHFCMC